MGVVRRSGRGFFRRCWGRSWTGPGIVAREVGRLSIKGAGELVGFGGRILCRCASAVLLLEKNNIEFCELVPRER